MNLGIALFWIFVFYLVGLFVQATCPRTWPTMGKILLGASAILLLLALSTFVHRNSLS